MKAYLFSEKKIPSKICQRARFWHTPFFNNNYLLLDPLLVPQSIQQQLPPSDVVGNIRFSHPTLYVFPGGQGDSALFGINGFNLLVDGGFSGKDCSTETAID